MEKWKLPAMIHAGETAKTVKECFKTRNKSGDVEWSGIFILCYDSYDDESQNVRNKPSTIQHSLNQSNQHAWNINKCKEIIDKSTKQNLALKLGVCYNLASKLTKNDVSNIS